MRTLQTATVLLFSATMLASPAMADTTIHVKLWDKGGEIDMNNDLGLGLGMHGDMSKATMGIEVDNKTVPAGKVTFEVSNASTEMQHEMLVSPIGNLDTKLPYVAHDNRVDEEASGDLGEVSELDPGKSGTLGLDLKPGLYILFCNIPGHYMSGMWTTIEAK